MDSLDDIIQTLFDNGVLDSTDADFDTVLDYFSGQGIDLTQYSTEEIKSALEYALGSDIDVSDADVDNLHDNADGIERAKHGHNPSFEGKMCPTRHGCTGATNCNYSLASYPG